ncbi:MAG TPA: DUF2237 domain-containing protein [Burkholderiales bacterium]|nr:DUF2237 domain-containing protein [Burkholderiales bacterium]
MSEHRNVLGETLQPCCMTRATGFYRNGYCETAADDIGVHSVCAQVTQEFLEFSKSRGNDLTKPAPQFDFPGLKPGDRWCLCAARWKEALDAGVAPRIVLTATHEATLEYVALEELKRYAIDLC